MIKNSVPLARRLQTVANVTIWQENVTDRVILLLILGLLWTGSSRLRPTVAFN